MKSTSAAFLLAAFLRAACSGLAQPARNLSHDVYVRENADRITFGNDRLRLELDKRTGRLLTLADARSGEPLLQSSAPDVDATVDGKPLLDGPGVVFRKYTTRLDPYGGGVSLRMAVRPAGNAFEFTTDYTLFPGEAVLERRAELVRLTATSTRPQLESFRFDVPGIRLGEAADCVVDAPGPFSHRNHVAPAQPLGTLNDTTLVFHSAPEAGFGFLALSNPRRSRTLASWMNTRGEVNYRSRIVRRGGVLSFSHPNFRAHYLEPQVAVVSDLHHLELTDGLENSLANYRRMVEQTMPLDVQTPAWVREAVILEVYPAYFEGGFRAITKRLPFYREVGFNTLYLMPHWLGGYGPIDPFVVDPKYGTEADLRQMVQEAHRLGMRVLFDMVIHGFNSREPSPVVDRHPEFFCRDERGQIARHPTWKSFTTDWADPNYQAYMRELVLHDLDTYGIDGYRVDAAAYKGPNWDPKLPYPAYLSGACAPQLMAVMLDALRERKPDAVLLSEVFGPKFHQVSNFSHDNMTQAVQVLLEEMERGEFRVAQYKRELANVYDLLPKGANRVMFARNHDTSWFYHFNGYSRAFLNMDAIHAFFAIPEVFTGDPKHAPNPDERPGIFEFYRKIFDVRKQFSELMHGEILLREVVCDNPDVFVGLRRDDRHASLLVISLSDRPQTAAIRLPDFLPDAKVPLTLTDCLTGKSKAATPSAGQITLPIGAYEVLHTRLY